MNCALNMSGKYSYDYSTKTSGSIRLFELQNTSTCNLFLDEDNLIVTNQLASFSLVESSSSGLSFYFENNELIKKLATSFRGSNVALACASDCECYTVLSKI